jgi:hypothetical protein
VSLPRLPGKEMAPFRSKVVFKARESDLRHINAGFSHLSKDLRQHGFWIAGMSELHGAAQEIDLRFPLRRAPDSRESLIE